MLNEKPCDDCQHFDPVIRGKKPTNWGWCAKKSVYPKKQGPGQIFPMGVKRVANGADPAQPYMVKKGKVVTNCVEYRLRLPGPSKQDLIKELQTRGGKRIIT